MLVKSIGKRNRFPTVYRSVSVSKSVGKPGRLNTRITHPQSAQLCYEFFLATIGSRDDTPAVGPAALDWRSAPTAPYLPEEVRIGFAVLGIQPSVRHML